jgi:hypothetical protein
MPSESITKAGFKAKPDRERFTGSVHGSFVDWAKAHEGVMDTMNRALTNNMLTSLNVHPNCRDSILIIVIES